MQTLTQRYLSPTIHSLYSHQTKIQNAMWLFSFWNVENKNRRKWQNWNANDDGFFVFPRHTLPHVPNRNHNKVQYSMKHQIPLLMLGYKSTSHSWAWSLQFAMTDSAWFCTGQSQTIGTAILLLVLFRWFPCSLRWIQRLCIQEMWSKTRLTVVKRSTGHFIAFATCVQFTLFNRIGVEHFL